MMTSDMTRAALPVSAVVNTYCQQYDGLESTDEVTQIIRQLEVELRHDCRSQSNEETSRMLTALRALGNAGLAASHASRTLDRCVRNNHIPTAIRVAAINAFRRFQCTDSIVRSLMLNGRSSHLNRGALCSQLLLTSSLLSCTCTEVRQIKPAQLAFGRTLI